MINLLQEVHPFLIVLVLVVAVANTIIAISVLRNTKRILRLSERRMQYLEEEQLRLEMLREEYGLLKKVLEQEREVRLPARQNGRSPGNNTEPEQKPWRNGADGRSRFRMP